MAASHPLSLDPRFPVGTVLGIYQGSHRAQAPGPAPVTTVTVGSDRTATITGLSYDTNYTAGATLNGAWTTTLFRTSPDPSAQVSAPLTVADTFRQELSGFNVVNYGLPNVAVAGNLDFAFSTGGLYSDNTSSRNRFQVSSYVENDQNQPTVAGFFMGRGKHVWALNPVAYSKASGDVSINSEFDYGNVATASTTVSGDQTLPITTLTVASTTGAASSGIVVVSGRFFRYTGITPTSFTGVTLENGTATGTLTNTTAVTYSLPATSTGVVIVAEGGNVGGAMPGPYVQMQSNTASQAQHGSRFVNSGQPAVATTGSLFYGPGENASYGVNFSGSLFSVTGGYFPVNSGSTASSFGLLLDAQGGFANGGEFIDIRATVAGSSALHGIMFRLVSGNQPLAAGGSMFTTSASFTAAFGLNLTNATLTTAGVAMGDNSISFGTTTGGFIGKTTSDKFALWGGTRGGQPVVSGSRGSGAALTSLLSALALRGFISDTTTA